MRIVIILKWSKKNMILDWLQVDFHTPANNLIKLQLLQGLAILDLKTIKFVAM